MRPEPGSIIIQFSRLQTRESTGQAISSSWIETAIWLTGSFGPVIGRLVGKDAPADAIREVEQHIYGVPRWRLSRIARVGLWETAFHISAVGEVWLVLRLLVPDITVAEAFLLESAGRFVTVAFKFVPYRLGVDEAGSGAVPFYFHRRGRFERTLLPRAFSAA